MASVRMTHELRDQIFRNATDAYELSNPEPKPSTAFVKQTREACITETGQTFLKQQYKLGIEAGLQNRKGKGLLPRKVKDPVTAVDLRFQNKDPSAPHMRDYEEVNVQFDTPLKDWWQDIDQYNRWGIPNVYVEDCHPDHKEALKETMDAFITERQDYREAYHTYKSSIRELLESCTTLKQLLEIWPAAESLVPSEKLAAMHVKVTRKQRAEKVKEEINFDPTLANQTVLTAKLLGG